MGSPATVVVMVVTATAEVDATVMVVVEAGDHRVILRKKALDA
jgi:hypothetical protein